jgi:hypothetical protein
MLRLVALQYGAVSLPATVIYAFKDNALALNSTKHVNAKVAFHANERRYVKKD